VHRDLWEWDDDADVRDVRHRVRQKLHFYRSLAFFVVIVGLWHCLTGHWRRLVGAMGRAIWGGISVLRFWNAFVAPNLWGREARRADDPAGVGAPRAPDPPADSSQT